jgi:hypothetical protein
MPFSMAGIALLRASMFAFNSADSAANAEGIAREGGCGICG